MKRRKSRWARPCKVRAGSSSRTISGRSSSDARISNSLNAARNEKNQRKPVERSSKLFREAVPGVPDTDLQEPGHHRLPLCRGLGDLVDRNVDLELLVLRPVLGDLAGQVVADRLQLSGAGCPVLLLNRADVGLGEGEQRPSRLQTTGTGLLLLLGELA